MAERTATGSQPTAPERVYRVLRESILTNQLSSGERLSSLAIAEQLGASRTPVRAALIRLQADGLVEITGGQSARVKALTTDEVEAAYDVAMALEGMLVHRLAQRVADTGLEDLAEVVARMEGAAAVGDKQAWVQADQRFHALLVELSDNSLVGQMMDRVETVIGRLRFMALHVNSQSATESADDHRAVVELLRQRDAEAARSRHHTHWERVRATNVEFLRGSFGGTAAFVVGAPALSPTSAGPNATGISTGAPA